MEFSDVLRGVLAAMPKTVSWSVTRIAGWRCWPIVLMLAAIAVSWPATKTGLLNDDYCHRALLAGPSDSLDRLSEVGLAPAGSGRLSAALSDQFVVVDSGKDLEKLRAYGALPWWTSEDFRVAFWRPVTSLTHWVDHRLFPRSINLMHLHSILWFAAMVSAVAVLYRRIAGFGLGGSVKAEGLGDGSTVSVRNHRQAATDDATLQSPQWVAGLAALMYLLADFSYFPTMWVANRNVLVSGFFGVSALILHDRCRSLNGKLGLVAAPACLLLSLLSAEAGIAAFAYLFAYEVVLRRDRWTRRLGALAPFVVVIVGWRLVYNALGYGATGGGFYSDPVREPLRYATAVLERAPFLLGGQWTTLPPESYCILPGTSRQILWIALLLLTVAIPAAMWPLLRTNRRARFWLLGMYASVLPICAAVPMGRALTFVAIGAFGLIAELIAGWHQKADWVSASGWRRALAAALVIVTGVTFLPWAAVRRGMVPGVTPRIEKRMARTMAIHLLWWWRHEDLVIVNAPNPAAFLYDPFRNAYNGRLLPGNVRALAPAFGALEVTRTQPCRLVIRALSRSLLDCPDHGGLDYVFFYQALSDVRSPDQPMRAGQRIVLPRMTVEVTRVDERGLPVEAAFDFPAPLEDPSLQWLYWDWPSRDYRVFRLPKVGETAILEGPF
jgi:hypothetical protein